MNNTLYVGNLSAETTETDLRSLFSAHGSIAALKLVVLTPHGRSRAFANISMTTEIEAAHAITALHHHKVRGRYMTVHEALPAQPFTRPANTATEPS